VIRKRQYKNDLTTRTEETMTSRMRDATESIQQGMTLDKSEKPECGFEGLVLTLSIHTVGVSLYLMTAVDGC
jgi:hypothetical protein